MLFLTIMNQLWAQSSLVFLLTLPLVQLRGAVHLSGGSLNVNVFSSSLPSGDTRSPSGHTLSTASSATLRCLTLERSEQTQRTGKCSICRHDKGTDLLCLETMLCPDFVEAIKKRDLVQIMPISFFLPGGRILERESSEVKCERKFPEGRWRNITVTPFTVIKIRKRGCAAVLREGGIQGRVT